MLPGVHYCALGLWEVAGDGALQDGARPLLLLLLFLLLLFLLSLPSRHHAAAARPRCGCGRRHHHARELGDANNLVHPATALVEDLEDPLFSVSIYI